MQNARPPGSGSSHFSSLPTHLASVGVGHDIPCVRGRGGKTRARVKSGGGLCVSLAPEERNVV